MLKKILLVGALAIASLVSFNAGTSALTISSEAQAMPCPHGPLFCAAD